MSHAYLAYPVVGILALAAALPIVAPSIFLDAAAPPSSLSTRSGSVVVSTAGGAPRQAPAAVPGERAEPTTDERWWRGQANRVLTTTSVLNVPRPAAPPVVDVSRAAPPAPAEPIVRTREAAREAALGEVRLTARVPAQIRRWEPLILKAAHKYDVDPALIAALMMTESSGNPQAVSPMGAVGLMQVLDGPTDPEANIEAGASMLSSHLRRFGSIDLALAAYNAGVGNVLEHGGVPPFEETRNHIARTLASYTAWRAV